VTVAYISDGWAGVVVVLGLAVIIPMNADLRKEIRNYRRWR